ncbi:MAG: bifunctional folylpolyglutamate synthase/dihydrofolate synthase [Rickettsiales bacterium]|nr:bifunctional folylpolyglutamate synthase/dihydrofolate synthase [Rickettsiales bacterium]
MVYLPHWPIPSTLGKRQIDYETVFERMLPVLEKLQNPHKKLPPVIHVSGTNGKGSATALLAQIFTCAGYKAHIYTSPHLHHCNERIILAGEKISDNFLFEVMEEARLAADQTPLTFMESFTIGAFLAFSKTPADVVIIECGMGGRIDATNIIEEKLATLIMPISFDHTEYLGNSIERIALEKAMILRPQTPLIVSAQPKKAREIIEILARDQNTKTYFYDEDFEILLDEESGEFDLKFENKILQNLPKPALFGAHQYINFATAIAAVLAIGDKFKIDESAIKQAISTVFWPSRLEKINHSFKSHEIWIDGAHNEAGALALAKFIAEEKDKKTFVICGFSRGKCKKEFLEKFKNIAQVIAVRVNGEPYPESAENISKIGAEIEMNIFAAQDLLEAISYAITSNNNQPCKIVICGSLHLARDVKKAF